MPVFNRRFPDHSIKWRRLGEVGLTLLERGEYQRYTEMERSSLRAQTPEAVAGTLNTHFKSLPTEGQALHVEPYDVDYFGKGQYLQIAYLLDPEQLAAERDRLRHELDQRNGVNGFLGEFDPHLSIATIPAVDADTIVLDALKETLPQVVTLRPALAVAT